MIRDLGMKSERRKKEKGFEHDVGSCQKEKGSEHDVEELAK